MRLANAPYRELLLIELKEAIVLAAMAWRRARGQADEDTEAYEARLRTAELELLRATLRYEQELGR